MAQSGRINPTIDEAVAVVRGRPVMALAHWCVVNDVNRMTGAAAFAAGQIEGAYRIGKQIRIATAPWREKLGIPASPELAKFGSAAPVAAMLPSTEPAMEAA